MKQDGEGRQWYGAESKKREKSFGLKNELQFYLDVFITCPKHTHLIHFYHTFDLISFGQRIDKKDFLDKWYTVFSKMFCSGNDGIIIIKLTPHVH